MRAPWTIEELRAFIPIVKGLLEEEEADNPEARGLPPMYKREAMDLIARLLDIAGTRPLTLGECYMHGQLMAAFEQAIKAEMLQRKERCYVVTEADLARAKERFDG